MRHKIISKSVFVVLISLAINACVSTQSSNGTMSDENKAKLNLQMGVRYLEMDMLKTAKEKLEAAESLDSSNGETHNILGVLYERLKQYQKARGQYQQAINIKVDDPGINNNYGRFLCDRGEYQEGMQYLNHALELPLNNRKWFAYTNLGRCELRLGNQEQAEINFRQALQENKSYSAALLEMQKISYRTGQYMSARAFLERYLGVSKHNAETLWYAVQTERSLGNRKFSEQYRDKLFNLFPASKEAQQLKTAVKY